MPRHSSEHSVPGPIPEQEVSAEELRQEGGRRRKKRRDKNTAILHGKDASKRNKGKPKVSREQMLLARLEKAGEAYRDDGETLAELAMLYADKKTWAQVADALDLCASVFGILLLCDRLFTTSSWPCARCHSVKRELCLRLQTHTSSLSCSRRPRYAFSLPDIVFSRDPWYVFP